MIGLLPILQNGVLFATILVFVLSCSSLAALIWFKIPRIGGNPISGAAQLAFCLGASWAMAIWGGSIWLGVTQVFKQGMKLFGWVEFFILLLAGSVLGVRYLRRFGISTTGVALIGLSGFLMALHMAFISDLFVPQYFDSLEHVSIIRDFLHPGTSPTAYYSLEMLWRRYYHFGFHTIAAWLAAFSNREAYQVVMVLGQFLLVSAVVSTFFCAYTLVRRDSFALWVALFAGLSWGMPAYAANWGKYPAIAAIAVLPICFGVLEIILSKSEEKSGIWWFVLLFLLISTTLLHTRALLVFLIYVIGKLLARKWQNSLFYWRVSGWILLVLGIAILIQRDPSVLNPYLLPTLLILLFLLIPGIKNYPHQSMTLLLFIAGLLLAAQTGVPFLKRGQVGLVDRPFVQIILFVPLSILLTLGLMAISSRWVSNSSWLTKRQTRFAIGLIVILILTAGFALNGLHQPNDCCRFVYPEDIYAFAWMENELPEDSKIVIAGFAPPNGEIGNDGGIWIETLTGHETILVRYDANWKKTSWYRRACQNGATHIYVGSKPYSFRTQQLDDSTGYQLIFKLHPVHIYKILGCPGGMSHQNHIQNANPVVIFAQITKSEIFAYK